MFTIFNTFFHHFICKKQKTDIPTRFFFEIYETFLGTRLMRIVLLFLFISWLKCCGYKNILKLYKQQKLLIISVWLMSSTISHQYQLRFHWHEATSGRPSQAFCQNVFAARVRNPLYLYPIFTSVPGSNLSPKAGPCLPLHTASLASISNLKATANQKRQTTAKALQGSLSCFLCFKLKWK